MENSSIKITAEDVFKNINYSQINKDCVKTVKFITDSGEENQWSVNIPKDCTKHIGDYIFICFYKEDKHIWAPIIKSILFGYLYIINNYGKKITNVIW